MTNAMCVGAIVINNTLVTLVTGPGIYGGIKVRGLMSWSAARASCGTGGHTGQDLEHMGPYTARMGPYVAFGERASPVVGAGAGADAC